MSPITRNGTRICFASSSGLAVEASTNAHDGVLDAFYRDYDTAFVLENEKESREGFAECLVLNEGDAYATLASRFGGFREFVVVIGDPATGLRVGGANFIAFPLTLQQAGPQGPNPNDHAPVLAINLNYAFTNAQARRRGYFRRLVTDLPSIALILLAQTNAADLPASWRAPGAAPPVLMFIEQNDPYRMPREDYEADTRHTGLDQLARIEIWAQLGARIVDFDYIQPPLTAQQQPDSNLVYGVLGGSGGTLDACLLKQHLERFFGISVLKGRDPMSEPTAAAQLRALSSMCAARKSIPLLGTDALTGAPSPLGNARPDDVPASLRALLRG